VGNYRVGTGGGARAGDVNGHNKTQLRRFAAEVVRARALFAGNVLVATIAWITVTLVH
jgi:hypothetical protein